MFDFNCNLTPKNLEVLEIIPYVSSVNICSGLFEGNPLYIKKALEYAQEREIAIGALVFSDKDDYTDEELEAVVIYQIGVIDAFASAYGLRIENVRLDGKIWEKFNSDIDFAKKIAGVIKKYNIWLNIITANFEFKQILEKELKVKCAYEVLFGDKSSIRELREMENMPETVHFDTLENAKRAYDVIKPSPVGYNRVAGEF